MNPTAITAVLDVRPMLRASENAIVERVLGRQAGVERVEANPVAQTATVTYDPARTSLEQLRHTVEACGYNCAIALPIAALSMAGSSVIVAVNALMLKRLRLSRAPVAETQQPHPESTAQTV